MVLCVDLEGWDGSVEGKFKREGIYVCESFVIQQKLTQHCKATVLHTHTHTHKELSQRSKKKKKGKKKE